MRLDHLLSIFLLKKFKIEIQSWINDWFFSQKTIAIKITGHLFKMTWLSIFFMDVEGHKLSRGPIAQLVRAPC